MARRQRFTEPCLDRYFKSLPDATTRSVESVLTYPATDYDGDWVQPDGGDWTDYPSNPVVNWSHSIPIGRGEVRMMRGKVGDEAWDLPIGTTTFFQSDKDLHGLDLIARDEYGRATGKWNPKDCLDAADDAWRMVADDVAKGVSVEFDPVGEKGIDIIPTGKKSLLTGRPAYRFLRWKGLGYAHALQQKNPGAMTLTPAIEKAIVIAQTGKHPGGKPVNPIILKAFASLKELPKKTQVRVEKAVPKAAAKPVKKAHGDDDELDDVGAGADDLDDMGDSAAVAAPEGDLDTGNGTMDNDQGIDSNGGDGMPNMKPTPMAMAIHIQDLVDAAKRLKDAIDKDGPLEDKEGIARLKEHCEQLDALIETLLADGRTMYPGAGLEAPEDTAEDDAAMPLTDDGALIAKAFPKGLPPICRRFSKAELTPVEDVAETPLSKVDERRLQNELALLKHSQKRAIRRLS